jgi:colanic acid/amylovoran biosynthesis protein
LIGIADTAVTSRFHGIIAALTMATSLLIVGWSHKYEEVMGMFGSNNLTLDSSNLDQIKLQSAYSKVSKNQQAIRTAIVKSKVNANKQVSGILNIDALSI